MPGSEHRHMPAGPPSPQAHCVLVLHSTFVEAVHQAAGERSVGAATAGVLKQLAALHGVVMLNECAADLLEGGYINGTRMHAGAGGVGR